MDLDVCKSLPRPVANDMKNIVKWYVVDLVRTGGISMPRLSIWVQFSIISMESREFIAVVFSTAPFLVLFRLAA